MSDTVDEKKQPLIEKDDKDSIDDYQNDDDSKKEVELQDGKKKDPTYFKTINLGTDFYSLTWHSLKKGVFDGKTIRGVKISLLPQDYFWIYINFIGFIGMLVLSVVLILQEALIDDVYVEGSWALDILRILLVIFTQFHLGAEIELAYAKFLYPIINSHEFYHPSMAIFIGFAHCLACVIIMIGLIVFICMADEFADPVINFAGICVLSELDDWLGEMITTTFKLESDKLPDPDSIEDEEKKEETEKDNNKKRSKFQLKDLNERIHLFNKMALIADDDNQIQMDEILYSKAPFYIVWFEKLFAFIPWRIILPLSTIPISHFLPQATTYLRKRLGYN